MNTETRIQELEAKVAELTSLIERLGTAPNDDVPEGATVAATEPTVVEAATEPVRSNRRNLLKLAGAAAAGAVAATATNTLPAAAADGDALKASQTVSTTAGTNDTTGLTYENSAAPTVPGAILGTTSSANIFLVRDKSGSAFFLGSQSQSTYPAAVAGYSYRTVAHGMYGYTANAGYGVVGFGGGTTSIGLLARGTKANLELLSEGTAPTARTDAHTKGELINDTDGNVWVCVASGTPGTWRKVAGTATAGSFHAITPGRVYDSRLAQPAGSVGTIAAGQNRTVSVADQRVLDTGAVSTANLVPAGATAVTANITVVNTTGSGFLACNPGGVTTVSASTINWSAAGQILANGVTLTLNTSRQLTIVCGGTGSTDFIVDISGYYL